MLPTTAGGYIIFRSGQPNGRGLVESGLRTEDEAHAALLRHAKRFQSVERIEPTEQAHP